MTYADASENPSQGRIACFLPNLDGGGAERVMIHLAGELVQRGWIVDLVVGRGTGAYADNLPAKVNLVNLQATSPQVLTKTLALAKYLRKYRPDALLTTLDIVNAGAWAQRLAGVPTKVIMIVQTHLSQQFSDRHSAVVQWARSQIVKQFYPWANQIVAVSQGVADNVAAIMKVSPKQIHVIYNPVVFSDLAKKAAEPVAHPWFGEGQVPVILGAGRLVKQKDFATLVKAFALVRQQRPCRLAILGDTDEREADIKPALDQLIANLNIEQDVAFIGFVENPYQYMARAQVFVLSSIYEGFGNVVAEALAVGTSVVSTDCESGPAEILAQGKFGRLVTVGDSNALAIAIIEALDHPHSPAVLENRARNFTVETIVDEYCQLIKS